MLSIFYELSKIEHKNSSILSASSSLLLESMNMLYTIIMFEFLYNVKPQWRNPTAFCYRLHLCAINFLLVVYLWESKSSYLMWQLAVQYMWYICITKLTCPFVSTTRSNFLNLKFYSVEYSINKLFHLWSYYLIPHVLNKWCSVCTQFA